VITIKNAVLNFPELFQLGLDQEGKQKTKYSTKIILDPKEHAAVIRTLQAEIDSLMKEKWKTLKLADDRRCLRDGDSLGKEEYEGKLVLSASSKKRPVAVMAQNGALVPVTQDDGKFYSGCIANANVSLWAQDNKFGKRINCELLAVQWKADGTPLGGGGISREAAVEGFDLDEDDFG
jgi:hypothetical protein